MTQAASHTPRWDVSNVYPSLDSAEFKADFDLMNTSVDALFAYLNEHKISKNAAEPTKSDPSKLAANLDHLVKSQITYIHCIAPCAPISPLSFRRIPIMPKPNEQCRFSSKMECA